MEQPPEVPSRGSQTVGAGSSKWAARPSGGSQEGNPATGAVDRGKAFVPSSRMSTIAERIAQGDKLHIYCGRWPRCPRNMSVDLAALAERLGPDHGAMHWDLERRFRCSECGHNRSTFIVSSAAAAASSRPHPETGPAPWL